MKNMSKMSVECYEGYFHDGKYLFETIHNEENLNYQ
jgi:hypothetical protein